MADKICSFKDYMSCKDDKKLSKTRKKINRKDKKGRSKNVYGWGGYGPPPNLSGAPGDGGSGGDGGGGGMGESISFKRQDDVDTMFNKERRGLDWVDASEEDAEEGSKKQQAKSLYVNFKRQDMSKAEMVDSFQKQLGVTQSTAVSYYERIAKEMGDTNQDEAGGEAGGMMGADPAAGMPGGEGDPNMMMGMDGEMGMGEEPGEEYQDVQDWENPNRQGTIRRVPGAHLVYKRQTDDGSFEELWVLKQEENSKADLDIRRDIIAGTDIPVNKTQSEDKTQRSEIWNSGNVQMIKISGLKN